jgi:pimeloyl-ACP methyl ester carboxylesterase
MIFICSSLSCYTADSNPRFDKTYWDLPYNNFNYSYIDVAVDQYGYCTLSYDRFGIGNSSHADPYEIVQAPAEISALYQLNSMLRMGTLPTVDSAFNGSGTIVNVGHSFGSQQSYQLAAMYPNITDALILTGFSFNGTGLPRTAVGFNAKIARLNQPARFGSTDAAVAIDVLSMACNGGIMAIKNAISALNSLNLTVSDYQNILQTTEICDLIAGYSMVPAPIPQDLPAGYLTWADTQNNQFNFLYEPGFDTGILYYSEQNKQPFTVGELLTLGGAPARSPFTGPVQVVTGRQDGPYCAGDCLATGDPAKRNIPAGIEMYLPEASNFTTLIPEDTGHGLNLHYSAVAAYQQIQEFLKANDIAPS